MFETAGLKGRGVGVDLAPTLMNQALIQPREALALAGRDVLVLLPPNLGRFG